MVMSSSLAYDEIAAGSASACGSLIIILTYLLFNNLRKLRYIELVFYVAVNDFIASVGLALGPSPNDSFACWFQGLSSTINFISSAFWTVIILYQVYLVVVQNGKVLQNMFWIHVFCWGWPLTLALLPLTTNTYNNPDDESTWCFVSSTRYSPPWGELFWILFSFFVWMWLSMLVNCIQIALILQKLRNMQVVSTLMTSTIRKLIFYPCITVVCWSLNTIANVYVFSSGASFTNLSAAWDAVSTLGIILAGAQGVFNAIVFISMNTIVREHWSELFYRMYRLFCCCTVDKDRPPLRSKSDAFDYQPNTPIIKNPDSFLDETDSSHHLEMGPMSQYGGNIFRDTAVSDLATGARLSTYFSVALPVEELEDYIGGRDLGNQQEQSVGWRSSSMHRSTQPAAVEEGREGVQLTQGQQRQHRRSSTGTSSKNRGSVSHQQQQQQVRDSSIFGYIRQSLVIFGSEALYEPDKDSDHTDPTTTTTTTTTAAGTTTTTTSTSTEVVGITTHNLPIPAGTGGSSTAVTATATDTEVVDHTTQDLNVPNTSDSGSNTTATTAPVAAADVDITTQDLNVPNTSDSGSNTTAINTTDTNTTSTSTSTDAVVTVTTNNNSSSSSSSTSAVVAAAITAVEEESSETLNPLTS